MSRLVLTRRLNESVVIHRDDEVIATVKVSRIDRNAVRLTFVADTSTAIDREEVYSKEKPTKEKELIQACKQATD
jgi:carbon storage regulator CsrA